MPFQLITPVGDNDPTLEFIPFTPIQGAALLPPVITTPAVPVIAGTGKVGDAVTVTPVGYTTGTPATVTYIWYVDGVPLATATSYQFPSQIGKSLTMRMSIENTDGITLSDPSNAIPIIAATSGVVAFPAQVAPASWAVVEDARTPEVQVTFHPQAGFVCDFVNFDYYFVCRTVTGLPADPTGSTQITSQTVDAPRTGGARAKDTVIYSNVAIVRKSDGAVQNATSGAAEKTQTLVGTVTPPQVDFATPAPLPTKYVTEGVSTAKAYYDINVSGHMSGNSKIAAIITNGYAAYKGNAAAVTWVADQIDTFTANGGARSPIYEGAYMGQNEASSSALAFFALRTPAVMALLSTAQKAVLPLWIEAGMYTGAALYADGNSLSPQRNMRGRDAGYKTSNPNISVGSPACMIIGILHFGLTAALAKLAAFNKNTFRDALNANGLAQQAYLTYNGSTAGTTSPAAVPTPTQMASWLSASPFKIRGFRLDTQMQQLTLNIIDMVFGKEASGAEGQIGGAPAKILPGVKWVMGKDSNGNSFDGKVGVPVRTKSNQRRGFVTGTTDANYSTKASACPFYNETGQVAEMNSQDAGGQRSAVSYCMGSYSNFLAIALPLMVAMPSWWDWRDDAVVTSLTRARRGMAHLRYVTENGYLSLAHANEQSGSNNEDWSLSSHNSSYKLGPIFSAGFDVFIRWCRESSILPALAGGLAQWEAPIDW